jgi:drug/metabolite transporter (DMT)-like permease
MRKKAILALAVATLFWGTTYPVIKHGLSGLKIPPLLFLLLRFFVATAAAMPLLLIKRIRKESLAIMLNPDIALLGLLNGLAYTFQFVGLKSVQAGIASIIFNTYVVFAAIFTRFILKEPIGKQKTLAIISGFLGALIISLGNLHAPARQDGTSVGILLVLICGVITGLYVAYSEKIMKKKDGGEGPSPLSIFLVSTIYTLIFLLIEAAVFRDLRHLVSLDTGSLSWICYLGVCCTFCAFILYLYGVKVLGAVNSSVFLLGQVVISIIISMLLLNEKIDLFTIAGALFIFGAIWLAGNHRRQVKQYIDNNLNL